MSQTSEENTELDREFESLTMMEAIERMNLVQLEKEAAEAVLKEITKKFDFLRLIKVPKLMDDSKVNSVNVEGIGRVTITGDLYVSIPAEHKQNAYQWLSDTGHGDLVTQTINASTLKAAVKQMIVNGEELPEEMFKVTPFSRASITRARK